MTRFFPRILAASLILALSLPARPALALRFENPAEAAGETALTRRMAGLEEQPTVKLYTELAKAHTTGGRFAEAEAEWSKAIELAPQKAGLYVLRSHSRMQQGKFAEAEADATTVIRLSDPADHARLASTYMNRGLARFRQKRYAAAVEDWEQTIELNGPDHPLNIAVYDNLAKAFLDQNLYRRAQEVLTEIIRIRGPDRPKNVGSYVRRATTRIELGQMEGAEEDLQKALLLDPASIGAHSVLARLRRLEGRAEEAEQLSQRANALSQALTKRAPPEPPAPAAGLEEEGFSRHEVAYRKRPGAISAYLRGLWAGGINPIPEIVKWRRSRLDWRTELMEESQSGLEENHLQDKPHSLTERFLSGPVELAEWFRDQATPEEQETELPAMEMVLSHPEIHQILPPATHGALDQARSILDDFYRSQEWPEEAFPKPGRKLSGEDARWLQRNRRLAGRLPGKIQKDWRLLRSLRDFAGEEPWPSVLAGVLNSFRKVPRHLFMPRFLSRKAFWDLGLQAGYGQTISQPSLMAVILTILNLKGHEKVLEIGAGTGWFACLAAQQANQVYSTERIPFLVERAKRNVEKLGLRNVTLLQADQMGYPEQAPYDVIIVSAGSRQVPPELIDQLAPGGRMIIPVYTEAESKTYNTELYALRLYVKEGGKLIDRGMIQLTKFVPLQESIPASLAAPAPTTSAGLEESGEVQEQIERLELGGEKTSGRGGWLDAAETGADPMQGLPQRKSPIQTGKSQGRQGSFQSPFGNNGKARELNGRADDGGDDLANPQLRQPVPLKGRTIPPRKTSKIQTPYGSPSSAIQRQMLGSEPRQTQMKEEIRNNPTGIKLNGRGVPAAEPSDPDRLRPKTQSTGTQLPSNRTKSLPLGFPFLTFTQLQSRPQEQRVEKSPDNKYPRPERLLADEGPHNQPSQNDRTGVGQEADQGDFLSGRKSHTPLVYQVPMPVTNPPAAGLEEQENDIQRYKKELARTLLLQIQQAQRNGSLPFVTDSSYSPWETHLVSAGSILLLHLHIGSIHSERDRSEDGIFMYHNPDSGFSLGQRNGLLVVPETKKGRIIGVRNVLVEAGVGDKLVQGLRFYIDLQEILADHPREAAFFLEQLGGYIQHHASDIQACFNKVSRSGKNLSGETLLVSNKPTLKKIFPQKGQSILPPIHFRELQGRELLKLLPSPAAGLEERQEAQGQVQAMLSDWARPGAPVQILDGHLANKFPPLGALSELHPAIRIDRSAGLEETAGLVTQLVSEGVEEAVYYGLDGSPRAGRFQRLAPQAGIAVAHHGSAPLKEILLTLLANLSGLEEITVRERVDLDNLAAWLDRLA